MRDYSLWLLPPARERAAWRALIRRLAAAFDAPAFEPHVTLLGGIAAPRRQVLAAAREWAASCAASGAPLVAHPRALAHLDEYYRCVFVELEKTPELLAARRRAETIFDRAGDDYFPHLSLLYGHFDAAARRRAIAAVADLAVADPAVADPAVADPAFADPAIADPAAADPAAADPAVADPAVADPAVADPAIADPAIADPAAADPAAADPAAADPAAADPLDAPSDMPFDAPFALSSAALVAMGAGGTPAGWEVAEVLSLAPCKRKADEERGALQ